MMGNCDTSVFIVWSVDVFDFHFQDEEMYIEKKALHHFSHPVCCYQNISLDTISLKFVFVPFDFNDRIKIVFIKLF